jgi:hypothetical protein
MGRYKIHIENDDPPVEFFESRIKTESAPIKIVETKVDALRELQALVERGITNVYAVGFDWPPATSEESIDAPRP